MSDIEEPPQKVTKLEVDEAADTEMLEDCQEEWLSEEVYTDDDCVPGDKTVDQDNAASTSITPQSSHNQSQECKVENIEDTLNNLDGDKEMPNLDAFLIRKTDGKVVGNVVKDKEDLQFDKAEPVDGNDTDDLLRMLGEVETKAKKKLMKVKDRKPEVKQNNSSDEDDDDDNFVYEGAKVTRLRVAKNALLHKYPATKAVPEDTSDGGDESEQSTDEASTVQKIFSVKRSNVAAKSTSKPATRAQHKKQTVKHAPQVNKEKPSSNQTKSILKPVTPKVENMKKSAVTFKTNVRSESTSKMTPSKMTPSKMTPSKMTPSKMTTDKIMAAKIQAATKVATSLKLASSADFDNMSNIDEEEFLDEDEFDLNEEEFAEESDMEMNSKQRLQRPERMDEEVPSDGESHSEDGSLYDELPSSDSDELEDWFTIDIREERAGDYLPILGSKAYEMLSAEKRRVSDRLATLRESLTSLTDSGRQQADDLRHATMALAELDDMLKAS